MHAKIWLNLKNIVGSTRSQTQNATYLMIQFVQNNQKRQIQRDKKKISSFQGLELATNEE